MLPDADREDIARRTRELAALVKRVVPTAVRNGPPFGWEAVAGLLLARIAGQGEAIATLIERGHEVDGRMVLRSLFDHFTLLAWLSVHPSELPDEVARAREWKARNPARNTLWWQADQFRREQRRVETQHVSLGGLLDADYRRALRVGKKTFKEPLGWGEFPSVERMAEEVDARYGGHLEGWASAEPGDIAYRFTVRGMYLTLYMIGSSSTHPDLGTLLATYAPEPPGAASVRGVRSERADEQVDVVVGITAYLLLYAIAVASFVQETDHLAAALRILDRFDAVRGPNLFLRTASELLSYRDGRRYGTAEDQRLSIERAQGTTTFVLVGPTGWTRLRHEPGPRWLLDGETISTTESGPLEMVDEMVRRITAARELIREARWHPENGPRPDDWPAVAP